MIDDWDELGFPAAPTKVFRSVLAPTRCARCQHPTVYDDEPCWRCTMLPLSVGRTARARPSPDA